MNVRRFTARTAREALILVRQVLGDDAVVLSTQPGVDGVEVLAMAPEGMRTIERMAAQMPALQAPQSPAPAAAPRPAALVPEQLEAAAVPGAVEDDVARLSMSTLSFQDYVRERLLRRRRPASPAAPATSRETAWLDTRPPTLAAGVGVDAPPAASVAPARAPERAPGLAPSPPAPRIGERAGFDAPIPALADETPAIPATPASALAATSAGASARRDQDQDDLMSELRQVKGMIEERFGALAFMDKLNRQPAQARLTQRLLGCGFSPALIRKIGDGLPADVADEAQWTAGVLERNLLTAEAEAPLEDQGGIYALVGATGVGKTTTTAKIAAAFAAKYGAANLGLITLDAYRIGAHEQLRAYGRILGVPVHTAHDRASLEDLLELLAAKKMVLIDTAGMAQRDARTRELLEMLSHRSIRKLLVINAASQGETIEDVMISYHAPLCAGIVLSKLDEAVKLAPALDAVIRAKLKVVGVANGQRVPEDWHRLSANALVQRALRASAGNAWKIDASDVSLVFTAPIGAVRPTARGARPALHA